MLDRRKRYLLQKRFRNASLVTCMPLYRYTQRLGCMTSSTTPTVTIHSPAVQQPVVLSHLTTFLLRARYAFLQTFHSAEHSDIDIFDQHQQLLVRCTIREAESDRRLPAPSVAPAQEALPENLATLIYALVQACTVTSEYRQ
jgi:hypothetical protein